MKRFFSLTVLLFSFLCLPAFANEQQRPKVSVVIPVYNVEPWIRECMDSLVNQTLKEIEIIPVDDGSPDNCGLILDEYARKDSRVKVIHQINSGVQRARNAGIAVASGEYITFVDSDDYLDVHTYEVAYNLAKKDSIDIIQFGHRPFQEGKDNHEKELNFSDSNVLSLEEFWSQTYANYVWDKLFKAELIKKDNIKFVPEIRPADDTCFSYMVMGRATKFKLIPGRFYNYRLRDGSLSRMSDAFLNSYKTLKFVSDDWRDHNCLRGKEPTLFTYLIRWSLWGGLNYAKQILECFNTEVYNPGVVERCPKYIQDWVRHLEYLAIGQEKAVLEDGEYNIVSAIDDDKVLDIFGASSENEANLQLWDKNGSNAQRFELKYNKDGYYTIKAKCSNKVLDVRGGNQLVGINVWQYEENNSDAQKWYIIPCGDGYYEIISKCNLLALDVYGANTKNGTNVQCWERNHSDAQKFKFMKVNSR